MSLYHYIRSQDEIIPYRINLSHQLLNKIWNNLYTLNPCNEKSPVLLSFNVNRTGKHNSLSINQKLKAFQRFHNNIRDTILQIQAYLKPICIHVWYDLYKRVRFQTTFSSMPYHSDRYRNATIYCLILLIILLWSRRRDRWSIFSSISLNILMSYRHGVSHELTFEELERFLFVFMVMFSADPWDVCEILYTTRLWNSIRLLGILW